MRSASARNPLAADYHNNLGNTYRLQGDLGRAISTYRQAIALDVNQIEALHSLANSLADRGDFVEAETCFCDLLRFQPGHADAHYTLGNAKLQLGRQLFSISELVHVAFRKLPAFAAHLVRDT